MIKSAHILILLGLCLLMYWPHRGGEFLLDDHYAIVRNPVIQSPELWKEAFQLDLFHTHKASGIYKIRYYRPLVTLSHLLEYRCWGLNVFGYRMVNIILHWLNACLVYFFILLLFRDRLFSFLAAFLFAGLPLHEWAVAFISSRGDLLQVFFSMLCLVALVRSWSGPRAWWYAAVFFFIAALLSKEPSLLLPGYIFLIALAHSRQWKKALITFLPFAVISVAFYLLRETYMPLLGIYAGRPPVFVFSKWLAMSSGLQLRFFIPWSLYTYLPPLFHHPAFTVSAVIGLLTAVTLAIVKKKFAPLTVPAALGVAWILFSMVTLAPALPFIAYIGPINAEHYLYFPSIGFALIAGSALRNLSAARLRLAIVLGLGLYFLAVGLMNRHDWRSERSILEKMRDKDHDPDSLAARELAMRFEEDEARIQYFIDASPQPRKKTLWLHRMGSIFHRKGDYRQAIEYLKRAVEIYPDNVDAANELSLCYFELRRFDDGLATVFGALSADPGHPVTNQILRAAVSELIAYGRLADALGVLERAQALTGRPIDFYRLRAPSRYR